MSIKINKHGIKINEEEELVADVLAEINGRAAIQVVGCDRVKWVADDAESLLEEMGLSQRERIGAVVSYDGFGLSSSAYRYPVLTTSFVIRRFREGWRLMSVEKRDSKRNSGRQAA